MSVTHKSRKLMKYNQLQTAFLFDTHDIYTLA